MTPSETKSTVPIFTGRRLTALILPLVLEQILATTIGMADTMMVSQAGQAAVSGISLVTSIEILLIQAFVALSTGGAVVASQYIGRGDRLNACRTAKQLVYSTLGIALVLEVIVLCCNRQILHFVYGSVEQDVMDAAETYFFFSALSFPALAAYNTGAALFRSMGNSRVSLVASTVMNGVNIIGNAILIYGFDMGITGAAVSSFAARTLAACILLWLLIRGRSNPIYLDKPLHFEWNGGILRSVLRVGVPSGIENSICQIGNLLVAGLITSFGTATIAANVVANNLAGISNIMGNAIGVALVTVVGQCVGARDYTAARGYTKKLMIIAYTCMGTMSLILFLFAPYLVKLYSMPAETTQLGLTVLRVNCVWCSLLWPCAFTLPNALRAAGDAKFTMTVSMAAMWTIRIGTAYVFTWAGMGLAGIWLAMHLDWILRTAFFVTRFRGSRWEKIRILDS